MSDPKNNTTLKNPPVAGNGSWLERTIFANRMVVLAIFVALTVFLGYHATQIKPDASFARLIPLQHEFIQNMIENKDDLENLGNFVRIAVATKDGDIFNKAYMETLSEITDEVFYLTGVDRAGLKSLWTPNVRWVEVTEEGFQGGPVIPDGYDGSEGSLDTLRQNVLKSGEVGRLVADNFKSTIVYAPLSEINPETKGPLDYKQFSQELEEKIRTKYETKNPNVKIHVIGFAKKVGDMIEGIQAIALFAVITIGLTTVLL